MKNIFILLSFLFLSVSITAQTGTLRGAIIDDATGEPILFGSVFIPETSEGTTTDLDGNYSIVVDPGTYSMEFSYLGYATLTIKDIIVTAGKVTVIDARIKEDSEILEEVVITATQARNTEAALATIRRKSSSVLDGISAKTFKRTGDSNAAAAVKRVPGVSIEGGKYVYVRGLGDRYTKSVLNGMDIPGLDPDRNTIQMDIFPTNVLDNIIVSKTFTADNPADFTGGIVNITTKDFPEQKTMKISGGIGYNPSMHFNSNYLTYDGGSTDFLGFDDGTREIPTGRGIDIPTRTDALTNDAAATEFNGIISKFNPTLAAMQTASFMDYSIGFSTGNQINKEKVTLGYNLALTYKNGTDFYQDAVNSRYGKNNDKSVYALDRREYQIGDYGQNNVLLGGLAGFAIKTNKSKYKINFLHLQNGEKTAGFFTYKGTNRGANYEADKHNLEYSQRSLSNLQISGAHTLAAGEWKVDWTLSPTKSKQEDPDIRNTRLRTDNGAYTIGTESGIPERIWRYLDEANYVGKGDINKDYKFLTRDAKLKFGGSYAYKQRDYEIQNFQVYPGNMDLTADPNIIFQEDNLFSSENTNGVYYDPQFIPNNPNKYDAEVSHIGGYVSTEINPTKNLKAIIGLRVESYTQYYTGVNQSNEAFDREKVLDNIDLFPTTNLIYSLTESMNLRASYSRTIARPSFKEASFATIIDPITGRTFIGGFFPDIDVSTGEQIWDGNLTKTDIDNFDLRWELYQKRGNGISVSGFYKSFINPIEIVQYVQATNNFQARNVGNGSVLGAEVEVKQSLEGLSSKLSDLSFNVNVTVTQSEIEMSETEYNSRLSNARDGEEINETRDMAGQAPFLVNAGFEYNNLDSRLDLGIYYNVQGRTLQFVGIADRPDVYSKPFHSLNFTASKTVGAEERLSIGVKVDNILDSYKENVLTSYNTNDEIFSSLRPQRTFSVSLGYKIF